LKGLLKGFKLALRPWESSKIWWRYDRMKFVITINKVLRQKMETSHFHFKISK